MSLFQKLNLILKLCSKIEKQFQDNGQYIMNSHCTLFYRISGESIILSCGIMCKPNHISKLLVFANWICNEENLWIFKFILGCLSLIAVVLLSQNSRRIPWLEAIFLNFSDRGNFYCYWKSSMQFTIALIWH